MSFFYGIPLLYFEPYYVWPYQVRVTCISCQFFDILEFIPCISAFACLGNYLLCGLTCKVSLILIVFNIVVKVKDLTIEGD